MADSKTEIDGEEPLSSFNRLVAKMEQDRECCPCDDCALVVLGVTKHCYDDCKILASWQARQDQKKKNQQPSEPE